VTELLTNVCTALEETTALPRTNVLGFKHVVNRSRCGVQRSLLSLGALALRCLALTGTAPLVTAVTAAVQQSPANAHTLGCFSLALVTN
jgi:hypothetical protein